MRRDGGGTLLLLLLAAAVDCSSESPPGKPVLLSCRSPEKETFTCWWEPGSDGGLPTTHRLYYQREDLNGTNECPDYRTAGSNSCFFGKHHTSIWVNYILTVVASNALGNTTSDPLEFDVMYIVQPYAPENVMVLVENRGESPHLLVKWEPPHDTDTQSGWITLTYQLHVKRENDNQWEEYTSGKQTHFSIFSLHPGEVYMVQVRCKLDHGHWSEWSSISYAKVPNYYQRERPFWILVSIFSALTLIAVMFIFITKRKHVKQCLLPPVPGPKIRGFDIQILKNGHPEDTVSALIINQGFPPMVAWKDQMEDYLVVFDSDDGPLPDSPRTQKRRESSIIPNGFQLHPEGYCKEPMINHSDGEKAGKRKEGHAVKKGYTSSSGVLLSNGELPQSATQRQPCSNLNFASEYYTHITVESPSHHDGRPSADCTAENIVTGGYVDAKRQEVDERQEDYSRVGGVNSDNLLFLHKETAPLNTSCKDKNTQLDCTDQRSREPHVTAATKVQVCTKLIDNGYVESVPSAPTM
ncbi:prolactin receptor b [Myripristis murdjan]|uniref:Prolactin receptor n=1 Tax=Myripristis murdjan TaxID=586833 RepID=A0A667XU59_9TELE|nr:prolactin receptor-like [Myripristis murdjan]